jgi:arginine-tRNA-protein transferase
MSESSLITIYGDSGSEGECGYCKKRGFPNVHYSITGKMLTVSDYEELVNKGFRRSGGYCYRYYPWLNCCPNYAYVIFV